MSNGKDLLTFERSYGMHLHSQAVQFNKRQLDPQNEGTMTLQSVVKYSTVDIASHPRTLESPDVVEQYTTSIFRVDVHLSYDCL